MTGSMISRRGWLPLLALSVLAAGGIVAAPTASGQATHCNLGNDGRLWLQEILDDWRWLMAEVLELQPELPWMLLFDDSCVFEFGALDSEGSGSPDHVLATPGAASGAPEPLTFRSTTLVPDSRPHDGTITLPDGTVIPAGPMAAGFVRESEGDIMPFFALAMVDIWRRVPGAEDEDDLDAFFAGVAIHEMVHTLQLVGLSVRIDELRGRHALPERLSDDIVQETFQEDPEFRAAFEAERDLFYEAVLTQDERTARALARRALSSVRDRRARFFTGEHAGLHELEDLFLNMEGLAVWAHYRLATHDPTVVFLSGETSREPAVRIERARARQGYWSQEEGFALALLLDRFVRGWVRRAIDELASPVALLEEALGE